MVKKLINVNAIQKARQLRDNAKNAKELRKALSMLLIIEVGLSTQKVSEILGISKRTIYRNFKKLEDNKNE
jgi:DeoR/GlpR family transcriptional regulator of sugar metabolism